MKYGFLIFISFFFLSLLKGQIVLDERSFPQIGDTLYIGNDNLPNRIDVLSASEGQRWDFSMLQTPYVQELFILPANFYGEHAFFPRANAAVALNNNQIAFFNINTKQIELVGMIGNDPLNIGYKKPIRFDPPLIERRAPLKFDEGYQSESRVQYQMAIEEVKNTAIADLALKPDSIRITITYDRQDYVDGWGRIIVPGGVFDALRERRQEDRNISIFAKVGNFAWQNITDLLPYSFFGNTRSIQYLYHSNETINPVAVIEMDQMDTEAKSVSYKPNINTNIITNSNNQKPAIYAYPNPAIVNVRFEFSNLKPDQYKLRIFNILGLEEWSQDYYINGDRTVKVNVGGLRKGTYLYSLIDSNGKTIGTKRLVVIKP